VQVNPSAPAAWRSRVRQLHAHWSGDKLYARDADITPVMYASSLLPGALSRTYDARPPMPRASAAPKEEAGQQQQQQGGRMAREE
jgi:hypothetical protein